MEPTLLPKPGQFSLSVAIHSSLKDGKDGPSILIFTPKSFTRGVPVVFGVPTSGLLIKLPKLLFTDSGCLRVPRASHAHPANCPSVSVFLDPVSGTVSLGFPGLTVCLPKHLPTVAGQRQCCLAVRNMGSNKTAEASIQAPPWTDSVLLGKPLNLSASTQDLSLLIYRVGIVMVCVCKLSHVQLFATPWTVAHQGPLSVGFFQAKYWSGLPFPSPGDPPDPGNEPHLQCLLHWQATLYH